MSSLSSGTAGAGRYSCPADSGPRDNHSLIVGFAVTFTQLRAFATVARLGSLSAAAAALGVSEPAVCSALRSLRRELGDPLYVRVAGGVQLTPGGERLAAAAAEILGLEDRMRREIGEGGGRGGPLPAPPPPPGAGG